MTVAFGVPESQVEGMVHLFVGTYDGKVLGFELVNNDQDELSFRPVFKSDVHTGCVKTVSASSRYLASGSTDETIRFDFLSKHFITSS